MKFVDIFTRERGLNGTFAAERIALEAVIAPIIKQAQLEIARLMPPEPEETFDTWWKKAKPPERRAAAKKGWKSEQKKADPKKAVPKKAVPKKKTRKAKN